MECPMFAGRGPRRQAMRKEHPLVSWLSAWGLLALGSLGGLGCVRDEPTLPLNSSTPDGAAMVKEADLPKRAPQPATLVAFGAVREQFANEAARTPAEKEMAL